VKHTRRLATRAFRAETGEFLAEGPQAVREALTVPGATIEVFASDGGTSQHPDLAEAARAAEVPWHVVGDDVMASIADTVQPQSAESESANPFQQTSTQQRGGPRPGGF